jgi:transaldolase
MNPLKQLEACGQSPWLDYLKRSLIEKGELRNLIERDGLKGVTSNPSIFEKAIGESDEYADALKQFQAEADHSISAIYEHLAIADIRAAADVLRPVFDETQGRDGYISLECSPYLANDTEATVAEALRLWAAVKRPNLMVKVPATPAGIPAIRELIGRGLNINITLLFAVSVYEQVVEAYISGLEDLAQAGGDISKIGSVASIFVSRIDTAVDERLDKLGDKRLADRFPRQGSDRQREARLRSLQGAVLRPALAASGGGGREDAAPALGIHQHQKSGLQGHDVCRGAHRSRHRGHHPAGDDGCIPRPWCGDTRRHRKRRCGRPRAARRVGAARHLAEGGHGRACRQGRGAAIRGLVRQAVRRHRAAPPHADARATVPASSSGWALPR